MLQCLWLYKLEWIKSAPGPIVDPELHLEASNKLAHTSCCWSRVDGMQPTAQEWPVGKRILTFGKQDCYLLHPSKRGHVDDRAVST